MVDPPPSVMTTSLVHRIAYGSCVARTPRSDKHVASSMSSWGDTSTPLIHPLNKPSCLIVCQATVLSTAEYQLNNNTDTRFSRSPGRAPSQVQIKIDVQDDTEELGPLMHSPGASLFEELETVRGSSWQYELQQLKFANQRLHEELHALEGAAKTGTVNKDVWRRSPLWLLVRVAMQMTVNRSLGLAFYKRFILFLMCTLARDKSNTSISSDRLHLVSSKILRRLTKLGSSTSDWPSEMALKKCIRLYIDAPSCDSHHTWDGGTSGCHGCEASSRPRAR